MPLMCHICKKRMDNCVAGKSIKILRVSKLSHALSQCLAQPVASPLRQYSDYRYSCQCGPSLASLRTFTFIFLYLLVTVSLSSYLLFISFLFFSISSLLSYQLRFLLLIQYSTIPPTLSYCCMYRTESEFNLYFSFISITYLLLY
jgi:hypothetical protein